MDFLDPEILEGIGNSLGSFVKIADATARGRYTSFARICVYMNISEPLPEMIELECEGKVWMQLLDYEHIPFRCRRCHEYGHLYKSFPLNAAEQKKTSTTGPEKPAQQEEEGFVQVPTRKRRTGQTGSRPTTKQQPSDSTTTGNRYEVLQEGEEPSGPEIIVEIPVEGNREEGSKQQSFKRKAGKEMEDNPQPKLTPMEVEHSKDDLSGEEKLLKRLLFEWRNLDDRFIPPDQKQLYKDTFEHYLTAQAQQETQ